MTQQQIIDAAEAAKSAGAANLGATPELIWDLIKALGEIPSSPGGSSYLVYTAEVTLTDDDIKSLPTTPFEITDYSGDGKIFRFVNGIAIFDFTAGAYTNVDPFGDGNGFYIGYNYSSLQSASNYTSSSLFGNNSAKNICFLNPQLSFDGSNIGDPTKQLDYLIDKKLIFTMDNNLGNLTGGNAANTIKLKINYLIIDDL